MGAADLCRGGWPASQLLCTLPCLAFGARTRRDPNRYLKAEQTALSSDLRQTRRRGTAHRSPALQQLAWTRQCHLCASILVIKSRAGSELCSVYSGNGPEVCAFLRGPGVSTLPWSIPRKK
ncbi:unnamed protein product [Gadus morhua 'NCC']